MSTRCRIAMKIGKDKYKSIYSHWDGYPEKPGVGWTLKKFWTDPVKVKQLIKLGDISTLGKDIGIKHPFDDRSPEFSGMTTSYSRDRGEKTAKAKIHNSLKELLEYTKSGWTEYLYVFENGMWKAFDSSGMQIVLGD